MFTTPYFYLYVISCVLVFALKNTMQKITPANPLITPLMGMVGLVSHIANYVLLILCLFYAEHWWYAPIMWVIGFILTILIPPTKVETIMGYLGIIGAPACTLFAYLSLFGII